MLQHFSKQFVQISNYPNHKNMFYHLHTALNLDIACCVCIEIVPTRCQNKPHAITDNYLHYITCHLLDAFIQSDLHTWFSTVGNPHRSHLGWSVLPRDTTTCWLQWVSNMLSPDSKSSTLSPAALMHMDLAHTCYILVNKATVHLIYCYYIILLSVPLIVLKLHFRNLFLDNISYNKSRYWCGNVHLNRRYFKVQSNQIETTSVKMLYLK